MIRKNSFFLLACSLVLCLCLIACGNEQAKKSKAKPPKKEVKKETPRPSANSTEKETTKKEEKPKAVPIPPEEIKKAKAIIAGVSEEAVAAVEAKKKFKMFCAVCHGFTGDLNINGAKDLTASKISLEESVAQVYHGRGLMTPFKGIMKDEEIVAVAKYIETMRK